MPLGAIVRSAIGAQPISLPRIGEVPGAVPRLHPDGPWEMLLGRRYSRTPAHRLFGQKVCRPQRTGKERTYSFPLSMYNAPGGLRQDPGRRAESLVEVRTCEKWESQS